MGEITTTEKPSPVGNALRSEIERRGLTAYRLNAMSGVSVDAVHRFLNREKGLTLTSVDALANALGLALVLAPIEPPSTDA
jgi:plasmid maintenance system antidote protein VapI